MKKLINDPRSVVEEMVEGLADVHPALRRLPGEWVLARSDLGEPGGRPVAVISGGGSGHEPAHAGYVGRGMLAAAVAGDVFTSPAPDAVLAAIRAAAGPAGVLLIVKNYTGDRLNFGLAAEMARAEGIAVEVVVVADDVALAASTEGAGRRGLAGTVLVHKVAGAAAEAGLPLAEVARQAAAAAGEVRTMGVALTPCIVPAAGRPGFTLGPEEIELGLGIHGEPGVRRVPLEPADAIVDHLLDAIVADLRLARGDRVVLLVNNLGATPTMELAIAARRAIAGLERAGAAVERAYCGTFLTSLEMAGISLSVLRVDDARLAALDAPTEAPAWPNAADRPRTPREHASGAAPTAEPAAAAGPPQTPAGRAMEAALRAAATALIEAEPRLTEYDQAVGDGDIGLSLARGAQAILDALPTLSLDDPPAAFVALGRLVQRRLGGTSGPLYGIFLLRAAVRLREGGVSDPTAWASAFRAGVSAISELGGARVGDRTMLDALAPASAAIESAIASGRPAAAALASAADAAEAATRETASMLPRKGRSSYLAERAIGHVDPGAAAVATWLRAAAEAFGPQGG